ncbi:uncharacterized protein [Onthophagus taurus]|uniref:uncharacterized protein n=1 Tax=Onthophagus taurus TaxID=166361 RepID=UPI0039BE8302
MSKKLDKLILRRNTLLSRLSESMIAGRDLPDDPFEHDIFLQRAQDSEEIYKEFKLLHNQIIGLITDEDFETHDQIRKEADINFYTIKALVHKLNLVSQKLQIDLLLGAELVPKILTGGRVLGESSDPVAVDSVFGWIVMGRSSSSSGTSIATCLSTTESSLDHSIQRFWELESIPKEASLTTDEKQCERHFVENYKRTVSGRFVVSLPFKNDKQVLGHSYQIAVKRLTSLEFRLSKNSLMRKEYVQFMKDYLESGHMSAVPPPKTPLSEAYYIPHHCVMRTDSPSTKFRVVFDASMSTSNGKSLNDLLHVGPKLQQDISQILLLFRCYPFAFTCDIKQMYRQILISPMQRDFQRILWRFSPDNPIQEYVLNTVTYGISSAPFLALRTLVELSDIYHQEFPRASKALKHNIYVDDIVVSSPTIEEALNLQEELIALLKKGKFELRKWASNCPEILNLVSESDVQQPISLDYDEINYIKVLGLQWDPCTDEFRYSYSARTSSCTKRNILSDVARIYDPLGFLTPCTLKAKHFIQQLWQIKSDWDEIAPSLMASNWNKFKSQLELLSVIRLPRLMIPDNSSSLQLHVFCDASQVGYCAVAYLRSQYSSQVVSTSFVCAKSRVAPLKVISVPRLELCGATLLADLVKNVLEYLSPTIKIDSVTAWTDSQVVLNWINSEPCTWKVFIANRVSHIQEIVPSESWRYVPSLENPADCGSRGFYPGQLSTFDLWWKGPSWLIDDSNNWPANPIRNFIQEDILKEKRTITVNSTETQLSFFDHLLTKFSSLSKVKRIIAYMRRFITQIQRKRSSYSILLSPIELQSALYSIIKHVQHQHFPDVYQAILKNQLPKKPFHKLALFIDRDGLMRVGGRLKNSDMPFEQKHPLLLPSDSRLSEMIIEKTHQSFLHPGLRTLHCLLLQQFWIVSARKVIYRVLSKCIKCFRAKPRSYAPIMADLPKYRVSALKAFSVVGIDYAGPFLISMRRCRGTISVKGYVCIFVCSATKAIHLELVSDMSTEAFIASLRRFVSRRGRCELIFSDNGTNFVGANRRLEEMANTAKVKLGLNWQFNPPSAPHFNGLVEAGVKPGPFSLKVESSYQVATVATDGTGLLGPMEERISSYTPATSKMEFGPSEFTCGRFGSPEE